MVLVVVQIVTVIHIKTGKATAIVLLVRPATLGNMNLRHVLLQPIERVHHAPVSTVAWVKFLSAVVMGVLDHAMLVHGITTLPVHFWMDAHNAEIAVMEIMKPDFAMQMAKTANVRHVHPGAERASGKALLVLLRPIEFAPLAFNVLPGQPWMDAGGPLRACVWQTLALKVIRSKDFLLQLTPLIIATYRDIAVELLNVLQVGTKIHPEIIPVFRVWDVARINTKMDAIP